MKLFNSLSRQVKEFVPIERGKIGMYACGMTVYDYAHIGHGRKYVIDDILRRSLEAEGYQVKHVQNVTDVGHLTSDADEGEDKLEKGAEKSGKTVWEIAQLFTDHFYNSMDKLNIRRPDVIAKATEHINDQIKLIEKLCKNGYAYDTPEAVYFDTSKFDSYGFMAGQSLEDKKTAVREEIKTGEHKKNAADFALWFKRIGRFKNHTMHWDSPWGDGFPGWHIECSAMSMKYLGEQFDIHTGGEDHLSVHHPNEIAQSEGATGKSPFVRYWVHTSFLLVNGEKMSKSKSNFYTIEDAEKRGFLPLALRYFYLTAHYRKQQNFTWEALEAAQNALKSLFGQVRQYKSSKASVRTRLSEEKLVKVDAYRAQFMSALADDLNTPQALAILWEVIKSNIPSEDKLDLLYSFDEVLGFGMRDIESVEMRSSKTAGGLVVAADFEVSREVLDLLDERENARKSGNFENADSIRDNLMGSYNIQIKDIPGGIQLIQVN